jgi:hypothetical protein
MFIYPNMLRIDHKARAKQLRDAQGGTWAPAGLHRDRDQHWAASGEAVRKAGAPRWKKTGRGELAISRSLDM